MSEISRRVRAARGYAGLKQSELGERLGQPGDRSVKRTEKGVRDPTLPEQRMIAEVCGLPHAFFLVDFERLPELLADPSHSQARVESALLSREEGDETPSPTLRGKGGRYAPAEQSARTRQAPPRK